MRTDSGHRDDEGRPLTLPSFRAIPEHSVEIDYFGQKIRGTVIAATATGASIKISAMSEVRSARIGIRVPAVFAIENGAVQITCGLIAMRDHLVLEFLSDPVPVQRRRHERFSVRVPLAVARPDERTDGWLLGTAVTEDISVGGACLTWDQDAAPLPAVKDLLLIRTVQGHLARATAARVLAVSGSRVRTQFLEPEEDFLSHVIGTLPHPRSRPGSGQGTVRGGGPAQT